MRSLVLPRSLCSLFVMGLASSLSLGACGGGNTEIFGEEEHLWELVDASGVYVNQIAVYQGVKIVLMENGVPGPGTVPIVAGRDALMRVWVTTDPATYNGQTVV